MGSSPARRRSLGRNGSSSRSYEPASVARASDEEISEEVQKKAETEAIEGLIPAFQSSINGD